MARQGPCGSVVEHSLGKGEVTRSIRVMGTTYSRFVVLLHGVMTSST